MNWMMIKQSGVRALLISVACVTLPATVSAQDSRLTYQGHLEDGGVPADGSYDLLFLLQDSAGNGVGISARGASRTR